MKALSAAGLLLALVALVLALVALVTAPEGTEDVRQDLGSVTAGVGQLSSEVASLRAELSDATSAGTLPAQVRELSARVAELSDRTSKLDETVARAAERPEPDEPAARPVDEGKLRELVAAEIRAYYARRSRIPVDKMSGPVKEAALKALAGFRIDHAHNVGRAKDGRRMYDVDGKVGARNHKVRVTSDGKVLAIDGRKPGTPPAKPAGEPAPFF